MTVRTQKQTISDVKGQLVELNGQLFYEVENYDRMPPFLMSVVSSSDLWMYVSTRGGLTAGRVSAQNCMFPYATVDKLHDCHTFTGPETMFAVTEQAGHRTLWCPFRDTPASLEDRSVSRSLRKHVVGDELVFEERHTKFDLVFSYGWRMTEQFGFIRTAKLQNESDGDYEIELIDGLQNLLPYGIDPAVHYQASCLQDAYKYNERDPETGMGIFSLTAPIHDRAEATEIHRATTVWCCGLDDYVVLLTRHQFPQFIQSDAISDEQLSTGRRAHYYVSSKLRMAASNIKEWHIVADVAQDHRSIATVRRLILGGEPLLRHLEQSLEEDRDDLVRNVASADGLQVTGSQLSAAHHIANVLFNNMRGGVFSDGYKVATSDFTDFVNSRNRDTAQVHHAFLQTLPEEISYPELMEMAAKENDIDLARLSYEYLPLTFGRRHGDPSRPWNHFEIKLRRPDGSKIYNYQGNWRDIFQNWEALCQSFPFFLTSVVAKFVNASTIDGFNPYRISRDGIDWEIPDPEDPWSNIGYWGDHQIVYLSKLLEASRDHFPDELQSLFAKSIFSYARVPYRIKPYGELIRNSKDTIEYDRYTSAIIERRVAEIGSDGRLVTDSDGNVYHVNLVEKLLVPALSKLSNFVPEGGIWLNTQRPEWNDANNALVGAGMSMLTVCYLRRYLKLLIELLNQTDEQRVSISVEVEQWFRAIRTVLHDSRNLLHQPSISDGDRFSLVQQLGSAFSDFRLKVYDEGFSGRHSISLTDLVEFFRLAIDYLDHSIRSNRRTDRLYHSYNLMEADESSGVLKVHRLYEMLEGQVAVLSSGLLDSGQAIELINSMFESQLYRDDQRSFMLYPERKLPGFLSRNVVPDDRVHGIPLLQKLFESGDESVVTQDVLGEYHFQPDIQNDKALLDCLDQLARHAQWTQLVAEDRAKVLDLFQEVFRHKEYTGRSGTMYGYEGLGCIYWHMVSKLLLAVQEGVFAAVDRQAPDSTIQSLGDLYYLVRSGLSADKSPEEYGAIPTDPYSHTPKHAGAQQPGMTGQVKEEILTRRGELGIRVIEGRIHFSPLLLRRREFPTNATSFKYFDLDGVQKSIDLSVGELAFTLCQVPVVYRLVKNEMTVTLSGDAGNLPVLQQSYLDVDVSQKIFGRTAEIKKVLVEVPESVVVRA